MAPMVERQIASAVIAGALRRKFVAVRHLGPLIALPPRSLVVRHVQLSVDRYTAIQVY